jgi:hypothetical protein
MPCASRSVIVSIRCLRERPNRSSRQTTRVSPLLRWLRTSRRPGRSALVPEM